MIVDYVRVYKADRVGAPKMSAAPLKAGGEAGSSTVLELRSAGDRGYVFLACELEVPGRTCSVNTGNALNASVVDFRSGHSQTAKITLTSRDSSSHAHVIAARSHVTVTAYSTSGEHSNISIPIE
jgi:hypothetical protein